MMDCNGSSICTGRRKRKSAPGIAVRRHGPTHTVSRDPFYQKLNEAIKIARMKDGTTHLTYKSEDEVELKSDLVPMAE